MHRLLSIGVETLAAAVFLLPLLLLLDRHRAQDPKRTVWNGLFALYLAAVYAATGLPSVQYTRFDPTLQLVPFRGSSLDEVLLNLLLFLPLGLALPLLWERFRSLWPTLGFGLALSLVIEVLQLFTLRGTDVTDLITNCLGTALGYGLAARLPAPAGGNPRDLPLLWGLVFLVMFFLQPWLSSLLWDLWLA